MSTEKLHVALNPWQRVIDDLLVITHLGIAAEDVTIEQAKQSIDKLIAWHVAVATDLVVKCGQCAAFGPFAYYREGKKAPWSLADCEARALEAWNRRAALSQPASEPVAMRRVRAEFAVELDGMDNAELRRRILAQASHIDAYAQCLDGLGAKKRGLKASAIRTQSAAPSLRPQPPASMRGAG